jgi:LPXTG-motif cell wall-anchored protein
MTLILLPTAGATVIESPSLDTGSSKYVFRWRSSRNRSLNAPSPSPGRRRSPSSGVIGGVIGASAIAIIALIGLLFWMLRRRKRNEESYENSNRRIVDLNSDYDGDIQTPVMTQTDQAPQQGGGTNSMMRQSSFFQPTQDQYSESGRDTMMPYLRNLSLAPPPPPTDTQSYVPYGRPLVGYRGGSTASGLETTDERMETLSPSSELQQDENTANPFVPESTARSPSTKADPSPILTTRTTDSDDTARMHREIDFGPVTSASSTHTLPPDYHQVCCCPCLDRYDC